MSVNLAGFWRLMALVEREYEKEDDELSVRKAKTYVDNHMYRADVVNPLPPSAPPGYLLVTPGDTNLYVGTGSGLRKIATVQVP